MASASDRTLYQFPISHYCEKTRWNLDAKGLTYRLRNLLPGIHKLVLSRIEGKGTLPILRDQGVYITDSTEIALYLEQTYPIPSLLPPAAKERVRALELEEYFDEHAGVHVRRWMYGQLLDTPSFAALMFRAYSPPARWFGQFSIPFLTPILREHYEITPEAAAQSRAEIFAALDRLEHEVEGDPSRYLAGNSLSLADLTAASLLGPLVAPPQSLWDISSAYPSAVIELREVIRGRPAGQWLLQRYATDRKPMRARRG